MRVKGGLEDRVDLRVQSHLEEAGLAEGSISILLVLELKKGLIPVLFKVGKCLLSHLVLRERQLLSCNCPRTSQGDNPIRCKKKRE